MEVPVDLLTKAQEASGAGITQTICAGLQLIAAGMAYERLLQLPGKVQFWYPAGKLRSKALARKRKARLGDALIAPIFHSSRAIGTLRHSPIR